MLGDVQRGQDFDPAHDGRVEQPGNGCLVVEHPVHAETHAGVLDVGFQVDIRGPRENGALKDGVYHLDDRRGRLVAEDHHALLAIRAGIRAVPVPVDPRCSELDRISRRCGVGRLGHLAADVEKLGDGPLQVGLGREYRLDAETRGAPDLIEGQDI